MSLLDDVRAILLDIEGTTTPIAFVHDVLFTYAREHVREFLDENSAADDIALLREEHAVDVKEGRNPPALTAEYVEWLIALDRKSIRVPTVALHFFARAQRTHLAYECRRWGVFQQ